MLGFGRNLTQLLFPAPGGRIPTLARWTDKESGSTNPLARTWVSFTDAQVEPANTYDAQGDRTGGDVFNSDEHIQTSPYTQTFAVPTALERIGAFSKNLDLDGSLRTIYDLLLTCVVSSGTIHRMPFANNQIPSGRLSTVDMNIASCFPLPLTGPPPAQS